MTRTRLGALALIIAGISFLLYPATRPWHDESTLDGAVQAMGSGWWVASHLFAMIGFILLPLGLLAVRGLLARTRVEPLALVATVVAWIGAGLTLPYYGAEDFALYAMARSVAEGRSLDLLHLVDAFRYGPVAATMFGLGLSSLAVGTVLAAVAVWRSGVLSRYSGMPLALGMVLFIPQFFTPPAVRIGHGVLVAAGCLWLAAELWRVARQPPASG